MSAKQVETVAESGATVFIPLNKLKKSPKNARKTPHSEASIEAYAASIAAKGILQNLVVEPELDTDGVATGFYFVTIGEGRRLAQLLRVKRKEIKKTEPIRCIIDTANDPHEISLDENVTRENMHPADQFEAFKKLAAERGYGAEEIAARFGVTPDVVRQRLRLGAVSPKLMQIYRDGDLSLDQLAQIFYRFADAHVLDIRPASTLLASHADGIEDTKAGKAWADQHARWAVQMPRDVTELWTFLVELDHDSRMALFAHCVALTVNAVKLPMDRRPRALATADRLAEAVSLDMTAHWRPTARTYFDRVTKFHILAAAREAVSIEAADRMASMKKQDMAEAAEQLVVGTGWLPALMRTPKPAWLTKQQPDVPETAAASTPEAQTTTAMPSPRSE